jgi:anti-sigma regulatory factor (Ser/Thr protein kinase)
MHECAVEIELPRERTVPSVARQLVSERFAGTLSDDELATARLLVSELVTNAVLHGQGKITFRALLDQDRLLVEVIDNGAGPEPAVRERDFDDPTGGGGGLVIVDAESSRWGVVESRVWFELERAGPRVEEPDDARDRI